MTRNETKKLWTLYERVSTARQGRSGLGLEAQREAVSRFVRDRGGKIVAEFVEVESGKKNDRPELEKALEHCELTGSVLLIARLDRLSRDAEFILRLQNSGVKFVAADLPDANELTVGFMAIIAQHERICIAERTSLALQASQQRRKAAIAAGDTSVKLLGGLRANAPDIRLYKANAVVALRTKANERAEKCRRVITSLVNERLSMNAIAGRLNDAAITTPRGKTWTVMQVSRTMKRLQITPA